MLTTLPLIAKPGLKILAQYFSINSSLLSRKWKCFQFIFHQKLVILSKFQYKYSSVLDTDFNIGQFLFHDVSVKKAKLHLTFRLNFRDNGFDDRRYDTRERVLNVGLKRDWIYRTKIRIEIVLDGSWTEILIKIKSTYLNKSFTSNRYVQWFDEITSECLDFHGY